MKFIRNFSYNFIYQVVVTVIPIFTVPFISRVLGAEGVGDYTYSSSLVGYVAVLASLGLTTLGSQQVAYFRKDVDKVSSIFWSIFLLRSMLFVLGIALYFGFVLFFDRANLVLLTFQSIFLIGSLFDVSWFFVGTEEFKLTVARNLIVKIVSVILIFSFVRNNDAGLIVYVLITNGALLVGSLSLWPYLKGRIKLVSLKSLEFNNFFTSSISYFLPSFATTSYTLLNKVLISGTIGSVAAGYFQQADTIVKMLLTFITTLNTVLLPRIATEFAEGNHENIRTYLRNSFEFVNALTIGMTFGIMAISKTFVPLFFGSQFGPVINVLTLEALLMIFSAWSSIIGWGYLLPVNKPGMLSSAVIIGAIVSIIGTPFASLSFGVMGATGVAVISELTVVTILLFMLRKDLGIKIITAGSVKYVISGVIMFWVVKLLLDFVTHSWLSVVLAVTTGGVVYVVVSLLLRATGMIILRDAIVTKMRN